MDTSSLLSFDQAARSLPPIDGKRPHKATLFRWYRDGVGPRGNKVRLECVRLGRRLATTREALGRFMSESAEVYLDRPVTPPIRIEPRRTNKQRDDQTQSALVELQTAGWTA